MIAGNIPSKVNPISDSFYELVEKELKNQASNDDINFLIQNKNDWRRALISLKSRSQMALSSIKTTCNTLHTSYVNKEITSLQYNTLINKEKTKRINIVRFLLQIELKIIYLKES